MIVCIATGLVLSVLWSMTPITLLRDELHARCSYMVMGDGPGSYACADGIGYLMPTALLLLSSLLASVAAGAIVCVAPLRDAASVSSVATVSALCAVAPLACVLFVTWWMATTTFPPSNSGVHWVEAMGPAAALLLVGSTLAVASAVAGRLAGGMLAALGAITAVVAAMAQPGVSVAVASATALLVAAAFGRVIAASGNGTSHSD